MYYCDNSTRRWLRWNKEGFTSTSIFISPGWSHNFGRCITGRFCLGRRNMKISIYPPRKTELPKVGWRNPHKISAVNNKLRFNDSCRRHISLQIRATFKRNTVGKIWGLSKHQWWPLTVNYSYWCKCMFYYQISISFAKYIATKLPRNWFWTTSFRTFSWSTSA